MRERIVEIIVCLAVVLGALSVAGWTLLTGQIQRQGIDGLFQILVCLLIAAALAPILVKAIRDGLFRDLLKRRRTG
jgi:type IV secretory pathway VirB6-like protein